MKNKKLGCVVNDYASTLLIIWLIISNQTLFHTLIFCFIYLIHVYMHFFILLVQEAF